MSKELRVRLTKGKIQANGGRYLELDGYCESPRILCKAWAHIGAPKSAQQNKVMTDALLYAAKLVGGNGSGFYYLLMKKLPHRSKAKVGRCDVSSDMIFKSR